MMVMTRMQSYSTVRQQSRFQSPDDVWTSGLAIPIVIVDGDTNKNSLSSNDVVLTDPHSIIPTLVTGDPFTLR